MSFWESGIYFHSKWFYQWVAQVGLIGSIVLFSACFQYSKKKKNESISYISANGLAVVLGLLMN